MQRPDLKGVEQKVTEEPNEAKHGAFRDGLVNYKREEDGVNPKQGDEGQGGLGQSGPGREARGTVEILRIIRN